MMRFRNNRRGEPVVSLLMAALLIVGCVPATVPPQLDHTPGPPLTVTDDRVQTAAFTVTRPDGWRVVTGEAAAPPSVILIAPDDTALVMLSAAPIDTPPRPQVDDETPLETRTASVNVTGGTVAIYAAAPAADFADLAPLFDAVIASVAAP